MRLVQRMTRTARIAAICLLVGGAFAAGVLFRMENGRKADNAGTAAGEKRKEATQYACPMHPFIVKESFGTCPICGMELVRKVEGAAPSLPRGTEHVALSPGQQVMVNLATVAADEKALVQEISVAGIVGYNQEREGKVTAWLPGRIDRLHARSVGAQVEGDRPVAEISSPELVYAQEDYLLAFTAHRQFTNSVPMSLSQMSESIMFEARERLRRLGFTDRQFAQLEREGKPAVRVPIYSPLSGVVVEKFVVEGQNVGAGDPLFSVADLSTVWVELEVYESDFPLLRRGEEVRIVSRSYPGAVFVGRVSFVYPFLDPKTRTVRVRVEVPNTELRLKPDMFVSARIRVPLDPAVVVPVTAVVDTGERQVVWVEAKPGVFVPRAVKPGVRVGGEVQILTGLSRGERVASSGGFLIDSESQFRNAGRPAPAGETKEETPAASKK